jgi:hypothetical protein
MSYKISRKRRRHTRRKRTLKRGGWGFKSAYNSIYNRFMYPSYKNSVSNKDFEPNTDDDEDDEDDVRRSSMDDSLVRHGPVTKDDLDGIDHFNKTFGGKRRKIISRRKRRF